MESMLFKCEWGVGAAKSGLRGASIPGLRRTGFDHAQAVNQDGPYCEGRIDKAMRLRDDAMAQNPIEIAETAGRIVAGTLAG
jgi:hypothetical protein